MDTKIQKIFSLFGINGEYEELLGIIPKDKALLNFLSNERDRVIINSSIAHSLSVVQKDLEINSEVLDFQIKMHLAVVNISKLAVIDRLDAEKKKYEKKEEE